MISGFNSLEQYNNGLSYFVEMVRAGICPTQPSFASAVVACVEGGGDGCLTQVHCFSLKTGFSSDCFVGNSLLNGYCKVGRVEDLRKVSDEICCLDETSIEILLRGYSQHRMLVDALDLVRYSSISGISLSRFALSSLISLCSRHCCIDTGSQIHGCSIKLGLDVDVSVTNSLTSLYARGYRLEDAENLFGWFELEGRDIVTWNSLVGGYAYNGEGDAGLGVVQRMLSSGVRMNESTFLSFLSCCAVVNALENAKKAHALIIKMRGSLHQRTDNTILTMYCRSNSLDDAVAAFEAMEVQDMVSFNLMMGLYRNCGCYEESIRIFFQAQSQCTGVDEVMLSAVVCSCSKLGFHDLGQQVHGLVTKIGFGKDSHINNSILELYSRAGRIDDMERIFCEDCDKADVFSWNMMLMGYTRHGLLDKSIGIWKAMEKWDVELNEFAYSSLLNICGCANQLVLGEQIHACVRKKGLVSDTALMNSLLTMYSDCGTMERAHLVFEETSSPDSISWNALVAGYSQNGFAEESVKFHKTMNENEVATNHMTYSAIFMSCAVHSDLKLGSQFHAQVIKRALESNLLVSNSLIAMYSKCGEISSSSEIFERMAYKDMVTWNSMVSALAHHGLGREAVDALGKMKSLDMAPNAVTFTGVLSACSHAGLVSEACYQFKSMHEDYGIAPTEEHLSCIVDILCRVGKLAEARMVIESMSPVPSSALVWKILLGACRVNGDAELGKLAAKRIMDLEPQDSSSYVLLSDLYASLGDREGKSEVRRVMADRGVKKAAGCSWILS